MRDDRQRTCKQELDMALAIVWRNPEPQISAKHTVQRIRGDKSCAVYVVTNPESTQEFKLISTAVA